VDEDRLASIAAQLAGRVRDDAPESNRRWLLGETDEADRWALLFVLAALVPADQTVSQLAAWHLGPPASPAEKRRRQWRESKQRTRATLAESPVPEGRVAS